MAGIEILGTGRFLPEKIVTNDDFARIVDTSDEWIKTRTGMCERHIASAAEPTWYMGAQAARQALDAAKLAPDDIDMIIATTVTSDYLTPSVACLVQLELGATNAFAFDISAACAGFPYALDMAQRYLAAGDQKHILIVCAETLSQITNYEDRGTCVLFGDGAGACVVKASDKRFGAFLGSDASGIKHLYARRTRRAVPFVDNSDMARDLFVPAFYDSIYMAGSEVYKFATKIMVSAVRAACERLGAGLSDLAMVIPHQANLRIIETAVKKLGVPPEKCYVNIHKYGNTSSASIAIGLDECARGGKIKRGDLVCLVGFGAGLTYGASVFEY